MNNDPTPALLRNALHYAKHGWFVFPTVPGTKRPACPAHPAARCDRSDPWCRHGHTSWEQRATQDPGRIRRAWSNRPYGIGIACGPSRLLVIDTDTVKPGQPASTSGRSGEDVLAELVGDRPFPDTYTVATPSGGIHRYYRTPAHLHLGNTAGRLGELIDTRGHGGYVVAPPTTIDDRSYRILRYGLCAELPAWIAHLLNNPHRNPHLAPDRPPAPPGATAAAAGPRIPQPSRYAAAAIAGETARVRMAPAGTRNQTLFTAAVALGQLVGGGLVDAHTVRDHLRRAVADHIRAGAFTVGEADATISSGLTRGILEPRTGPSQGAA